MGSGGRTRPWIRTASLSNSRFQPSNISFGSFLTETETEQVVEEEEEADITSQTRLLPLRYYYPLSTTGGEKGLGWTVINILSENIAEYDIW